MIMEFRTNERVTFRSHVISIVTDMARDAEDATTLAACRRLETASRIGWRKHAKAADWTMVRAFYDGCAE